MAERFERLFSLPAPAYSEGSAVLLEAGMLLRDRTSGRILVQLKFRNVSPQSIRALRLGITAYDSFGNELTGITEYQYTDLYISPGKDFAADKAILLSDTLARSFAITYIDIAFIHGEKSTVSMPMQPLPTPRSLSGVMPSLAEQEFRLCTCDAAKFLPEESTGLWLCPCGRWNSGDYCSNCHLSKTQAVSVPDTTRLMARAKDRMAEKRKQVAEEAAQRQKREAEAEELRRRKKASAARRSKRVFTSFAIVLTLLAAGAFFVYPRFLAPTEPDANKMPTENNTQTGEVTANGATEIPPVPTSSAIYDSPAHSFHAQSSLTANLTFTAAVKSDGQVEATNDWCSAVENWTNIIAIDSTSVHSLSNDSHLLVGLCSDGTVAYAGYASGVSQSYVNSWTDIVAISCGSGIVGLRSDGTVVAAGDELYYNQQEIGSWKNIVGIRSGYKHTVGLCKNGAVVAAGSNDYGQCNVNDWTDIVAIDANAHVTMGLRNDGTVLASGSNYYGQCDTSAWADIVAIDANDSHTVGLRSDGTVVAAGLNTAGQCNVDSWTDVIAIDTGSSFSIGLRSDGTVLLAGNTYLADVEAWTNIVEIKSGNAHIVGLRKDGTVVAIGSNDYGQCNVDDWADIRLPETVSISASSDLSTPVSTPTPTPTPIPTTKPTTFTNNYGSASTHCAYPGCTRNIVSSGDSNCCSVHSARCVYCKAYIDSDASICMDCITDALSSAASKGSSSSGDAESFYCMGKGDTCPNKTYSAYDFYCASCDPDGNNREG